MERRLWFLAFGVHTMRSVVRAPWRGRTEEMQPQLNCSGSRARRAVKGPRTPPSRRARRPVRLGSVAVDRIEDRLDARDAGSREPGRLGVIADLVLALREIDAVEL